VVEPVRQAHAGEDGVAAGGARGVEPAAGEAQRQVDVLQDGEGGEQVVLLEHEPDPLAAELGELGLVPAGHLGPGDDDPA
jgi:hypothetical protein